jgi:uncharacterized lipoprotein YajG
MPGSKRTMIWIMALLIAASIGLTGCRRQDKTTTPTPTSPAAPALQQSLPTVGSGSGVSPLPTPGVGNSPVSP